jgi:hypothetical protein
MSIMKLIVDTILSGEIRQFKMERPAAYAGFPRFPKLLCVAPSLSQRSEPNSLRR